MTADPIAGVPYARLTDAADMAATSKLFIDPIGALFKSGIRKGGRFTAGPFNTASSTVATGFPFSFVSGDNLVVGSNLVIPAGWGGTWCFSLRWTGDPIPAGARAFADLKRNTDGSSLIRINKVPVEDTVTGAVTMLLTEGESISGSVFCSGSAISNTVVVEAWRLT